MEHDAAGRDLSNALRESEDRYRTLFEDATDGLLVADVESGRFVMGNRQACRMLRCTHDELTRLSIADIHPAEFVPRALTDFGRQARGELDVVTAVPVRRRDGTTFVADISARQTVVDGRTCVMGIFRDASAREEAERALRHSEAKLRQSQRLAGFGHYELDVASGRWTSSEALDDLFGIDGSYAKDIGGWGLLVHPEDRDGMVDYFRRHVVEGRHNFDREYRIVRPRDGETRWVHGIGELELGPDRNVARMFGVIQDITERKLAEEERKRFEAGVQESQKLESLGILAGGIAHDFNNLLFCIAGNADLALADVDEASPARECLLAIDQASRRAADLCRQLLAYAGKSRVEVRRLDLQALIEDTDQMLALAVPRSVSIRRDFTPGLPPVMADATQLRQVLMNLVINAAEAMVERTGVIAIATGVMTCDRDLLDRCHTGPDAQAGAYAWFEVIDTGSGMDEATVSHMFEPFYSTKFAGRGLGLAAVLGIVRGHGGGIRVESEIGRGTSIRVLLPASDGVADAAAPACADPVAWRGSGTVLVVDDEDVVREVTRRFLGKMGFDTLAAADGAEALACLRSAAGGPRPISCVLLDLTMPVMDGAETLHRMREEGLDVPVLLASGYDEHDLARRFQGRGVAGFVQKPYRQSDLADRLRALLDG